VKEGKRENLRLTGVEEVSTRTPHQSRKKHKEIRLLAEDVKTIRENLYSLRQKGDCTVRGYISELKLIRGESPFEGESAGGVNAK